VGKNFGGLPLGGLKSVTVRWFEYIHEACTNLVQTAEYKPILEEVEKILGEAGLDEDDIKNGVAAGGAGQAGQNRNRR
jgi:hypothetical protein